MMIARLIDELAARSTALSAHWAFFFTKEAGRARRPGLGKLLALAAALARLVKLRAAGPIDLLVYPSGGPQLVPVVRDLCLLPFALLASRRLVIHFHAGGIADAMPSLPAILRWPLRALCRRADAALVMNDFGRADPASLGIGRIESVPHTVNDCFDPTRVQRGEGVPRLLYTGHLCADKGTPALLRAVAALRAEGKDCRVDLVGECLAPFTEGKLQALIDELGLGAAVDRPGVLSGEAKWNRFAGADLFVFPSLAPYESFGLVIVEAMMWSLPVVATDWRGNREVLGGECFPPGADLAQSLKMALAEAFARRSHWPAEGTRNRLAYERRFKAEAFPARLALAVEGLL